MEKQNVKEQLSDIKRILFQSERYIESLLNRNFDTDNKFSVIKDATILGIFISLIDKARSLNLLLENKYYAGNNTLLRSIFEEEIYLEYILKENTMNRTRAYIASSKLKAQKMLKTASKTNALGNKIREVTNLEISDLEKIFSQVPEENITNLEKEYLDLTGETNPDKWYKEKNNVTSFRGVCEYLGVEHLANYEILYRLLSQEVHGKNSNSYFTIQDNQLVVEPLKEEPMVLSLMRATVVSAGIAISTYYDDSEKFREIISII